MKDAKHKKNDQLHFKKRNNSIIVKKNERDEADVKRIIHYTCLCYKLFYSRKVLPLLS